MDPPGVPPRVLHSPTICQGMIARDLEKRILPEKMVPYCSVDVMLTFHLSSVSNSLILTGGLSHEDEEGEVNRKSCDHIRQKRCHKQSLIR